MKAGKKYFEKIRNSPFWKSVFTLVSGTVLAQMIGLLTTPIVSRIFNSEEYGDYAIVASTASIIVELVSLGMVSAVMVPAEDEECNRVFVVAFTSSSVLATALLLVMLSVSPFYHFFHSGSNYAAACLLVYLMVICGNLSNLLHVYVNRLKMNRVLFYNSLIGALSTLFVTIPLGLLKAGGYGLIIGSILSSIIAIAQMLYHANPFRTMPDRAAFRGVFRKYRNFVLFQYPSNFIAGFAVQLPTQMLSASFGNANMGSYSMCEKILGIPSRLIGTPINTVYFRTASEYFRQGKNLADFTFSLISKIMLAAFLPIIAVIFWGEPLFAFVLGENWREAGVIASFLILQYTLAFCSNCTSYCRVAIGRQKADLVVSISRLSAVAASILIGIAVFGTLVGTIICFAVGSSVYLIIDMAVNFYYLRKNFAKYLVFACTYCAVIALVLAAKYFLA